MMTYPKGSIIQVIGPVVDIQFENNHYTKKSLTLLKYLEKK
jgi:F0F1-type ATP synthase beta subunit